MAGFLFFVQAGGSGRGLRRALDSKAGGTERRGGEMSNVPARIKPYWYNGAWVFDDVQRGLRAKPFIARAPEIVDQVLRRAGLQPRQPFTVTFGDVELPAEGYQFVLEWVREDSAGHWYRWAGMDGLCPALVRYFDAPPKRIYCQVIARRTPFSVFHEDRVEVYTREVATGHARFSSRPGRA